MSTRDEAAYLTTGQVAARLGLSKPTLLRAVRRGDIRPFCHTPGGYLRFRPSDVEAYVGILRSRPGDTIALADMTTQTEEAVLGNALLKATHSQTINESDQRPADIQFQALTEAIPHIVWTARPDGWLDYYNQRWSDYTGMTIEETQGWGWGPVLHPDDLQPCIHRWAEAVRTGEPYEIEYRFRRASDGTYRWHLGRALPLCDADGQIVKWFGTGTDIDDEKRRVDEAQRTSEDRYRRIVETANEGIWVIDADSRTTFVNQRMADMLGYTVEAMQGRNFFACMDAEGQEIAATIQRRQDGSTEQHDAKFQRQDGTDLWARVAITPFYDQDGLYAGRLAMVSDVTARRRAEEERDRLFSLSLDMMGIAGTDGYFRRLNPAFERTLGWSTAELLGRPFLDFVHPDDQAATIAEVEKLADGQPTISFENRYAHADGSWRWLSWTSTPVAEEGLIFAVAHDTTARKQADEALRDSESLLRVVVANAPVILFALDQDGVYTLSEGRSLTALGRSKNEAVGRSIFDLYPDSPDILADTRRALAGEDVTSISHLRGSIFENCLVPVRNHAGLVISVIGVSTDITERMRAEEALRAMSAQLEESNRELQQFAYVASHDLQEPLRTISSYLQLLSKRYRGKVLDEEADVFIDYAVDGAKRLQSLIRAVLGYSHVRSQSIEFLPCDCASVATNAIINLQARISDMGANVICDELPMVRGDGAQLGQVFQNLIGNALKFSRGGVPPEIFISAEQRGDEWIVRVQDNGIGIPFDQTERIFTMFQRLHTRDEYEGTGIGLATCKKIVELHGGRIWVESSLGQRTTFFFTLPALHAKTHAA